MGHLNDRDDGGADFASQWAMCYPRLRAYVLLFVSPQQDAEDVIQETALAAARDFRRFDSSRPFLDWAVGIARNRVRQHYSNSARRRRLIFDEGAIASLESAYESVRSDSDEVRDSLGRCVDQLPSKARQIIESRYSHNLDAAQIANRFNMTTQSVYTRLSQIRTALRKCVERKLRLVEARQ